MTITLYGIPNCDTVKRARAWLADRAVDVHFHDFKKLGVPADRLDVWLGAVGREALLNRKGTTWRQLDDARRDGAGDEGGARRLMMDQPSVIKRPVVEWADGGVTVGFDAAVWGEGMAGR